MMPILRPYLKRFGEWATGLRERYKSDLFFRTTVHIVTLQGLLVVVSLLACAITLYQPTLLWYTFAVAILCSLVGVVLLSRVTLKPVRDTLRYQKLFISNVAHELRTPIAIIKTSTEVALFDPSLGSETRKVFADIMAELERISEIINNLLSLNTLTRPERMQFSSIDFGSIVSSVVRRHAALAREREIRVIFKRDNDSLVYGNSSALEQVVTNIIKNALHFTPKDTHGVIRVVVTPEDHMLLFCVSDTGVGISSEDLSHIFEPFYRADISRVGNKKKSGSGLGLAIVNEIVRAHRGKIQIESEERKGTVVSVYLPRAQATQE